MAVFSFECLGIWNIPIQLSPFYMQDDEDKTLGDAEDQKLFDDDGKLKDVYHEDGRRKQYWNENTREWLYGVE